MVPDSGKLLVAFSGGCDSLALLSLCVSSIGAGRTVPVYVNHNIRDKAELKAEISLNIDNCKALGLDLIVRTLEEGAVKALSDRRKGGTEDAARTLRYEILEEERLRNGCEYILTAHHRQDQIETIVMRLRAGSPMTSLKGISSVDENRHLLRPLLGFSRQELESYLEDKGLRWSTDSTNSDAQFRRNEVRNIIIPRMKAICPGFEDIVLDLGEQARGICGLNGLESDSDKLEIPKLSQMDLAGRTLAIFSMWDHVFPGKSLPMTLVSRVLDAIADGVDCTVGSNMAIFTLYHGVLYLTDPAEDAVYQYFESEFDPSGDCIDLPGGMRLHVGQGASGQAYSEGISEDLALRLDPKLFKGRALVRFARVGDRIRLKGGARMVLRLLQDMGVPAPLRTRVPVIVDDEGLCAVFGTVFGGRDRICVKFRTSLARNGFPLYIVSKG